MEGIRYFLPIKGESPKYVSQFPFSQDRKDSGGVLTTQVFFFFPIWKLCSSKRVFFSISVPFPPKEMEVHWLPCTERDPLQNQLTD